MKKLIIILALLSISIFILACGSGGGSSATSGKTVKTGTVNNLTVTLSTADGVIRNGANDFTLSFTNSSGKTVDVGAASVNFFMPSMGTMSAMNDAATLTTSGTPGVYNGKVKVSMAGEWQVQIAFEGGAGKGKTSFPVTVQ
ncbi:MAG TPA: FixH family protein [Pyrinomonadaceae bacterium]|nr:FixH family protein [Pyrinomonadaceae bacterium]